MDMSLSKFWEKVKDRDVWHAAVLLLLLLLLNPFSCVRLCATPWTAAHQAPPQWVFQARILEWGAIAFSSAAVQGVAKSQM